jgi:hypothetical protein
MSALNLIGIKFRKQKEKRKNNLTSQSYWTSHLHIGSQKIQQEKEKRGWPLPGQRVVMVVVEGTHI